MRRLMLVLALIGASALFLGTTPSSAGAAVNCQTRHSSTWWDGYLNFQADIWNCTQVDKVEFKRSLGCCVYSMNETGWGDGTEHDAWGWPGNHPAPSAYNVDDSVQNIASYYTIDSVVYRVIAWCGGQTHWVFTQFIYRIHSAPGYGNSWGPWHWSRSSGYQIIC